MTEISTRVHKDPHLFREPLNFTAAETRFPARLIDIPIHCISKTEAFAEKFRAALSRREPAIRDFFDIDYSVREILLDPRHEDLVQLVRHKIAVPGNDAIDVSSQRLMILKQQLEAQLRPVLREKDFEEFDLERAFQIVVTMHEALIARNDRSLVQLIHQ